MDAAHRAVAGGDVLNNDAKRIDIHNFFEAFMFVSHLLINAKKVLFSANHKAFNIVTF